MRCDVKHLKRVVKEALQSQGDEMTIGGVLCRRLTEFPDPELVVGCEAVFFPDEEGLARLRTIVQRCNEKLAGLSPRDENEWQDKYDTECDLEHAQNALHKVGEVGTLSKASRQTCFVSYPDGINTLVFTKDVWMRPHQPPDWRPDETLPEDYYSL